jgi:hypothetical protein
LFSHSLAAAICHPAFFSCLYFLLLALLGAAAKQDE